MTIFLWVLGIHFIELLAIGVYLLIKKNNTLEKVVIEQQQYLNAIKIVVEDSHDTLTKLDNNGAYSSDDELGVFFQNLKQIQQTLNSFFVK
jgi:stage III sporulation protein SpoIIIAA